MNTPRAPIAPPRGFTLLSRRARPNWILLLVALIFGSFTIHALMTGEISVGGGRNGPVRRYTKAAHPEEYSSRMITNSLLVTVVAALAFLRVDPIEDLWKRQNRTLQRRLRTDKTPAPLWAYAFLVAFIALIGWIGWKTMYND